MDDGYLNINIVSIVFAGYVHSECENAKNFVFHQPISTDTSSQIHLSDHTIYFRQAGAQAFTKVIQSTSDAAFLCSVTDKPQEKEQDNTLKSTLNSKDGRQDNLELSDTEKQSASNNASIQNQEKKLTNEEERQTDESQFISDVQYYSMSQLEQFSDVSFFTQKLAQYKNSGKIEFYLPFNISSCIHMVDIVRLFIKNVSLCVLIANSSNQDNLNLLEICSTFCSKGLMIDLTEDFTATPENESEYFLEQYSTFLTHHEGQPGKYLFHMNFKQPQERDFETGAKITKHALSATNANVFPFSWYLFGFRLRNFMILSSTRVLNVPTECMKIAESLKMDRPTVEAALTHLTENNIIVYFRDILRDTVFASANMFIEILATVSHVSKVQSHTAIVSHSKLINVLKPYTNIYVSADDYTKLFLNLYIIGPYSNSSYLFPYLLKPLNEMDRKEACLSDTNSDQQLVYFKCPSTGFEYVVMLTAFLLNKQWRILEHVSGNPVCLYKNCTKFLAHETIISISFSSPFIVISLSTEHNLKAISTTILNGLEKIKLLINAHQDFEFSLSFQCNCGRSDKFHTMVYIQDLGVLQCEEGDFITALPRDYHIKWIRSKSGMS